MLKAVRKDAKIRPEQVDALEQSMRRTRGVNRVHFDLENWERLPTGQWSESVTALEQEDKAGAAAAESEVAEGPTYGATEGD